MRRSNIQTIITMVVLSLIAVITTVVMLKPHKSAADSQSVKKRTVYHCAMHPQYFSDKPGDCPVCGMKLVPVAGDNPADTVKNEKSGGGSKILYYRDAMNPSRIYNKPGKAPDGMDLVPVYESDAGGEPGMVKIDPTTIQNIGVTTETAVRRDLAKEIRASAGIELNETSVKIINTKIMGWVEKLYVDYTGQPVKKGQPLLTIYSPDLVSTQEEFLQAIKFLRSLPKSASPDAVRGAEELVESSRRRLAYWDISSSEIADIEAQGTPRKTMTIYAPASGVVIEKTVIEGQNIQPGTELYKIADLSTVWAMANVYQEDLAFVKTGQAARITVPSLAGQEFVGTVQFVSPVLDETTKTAAVRIAVFNTPDFALKPQMFATVILQTTFAKQALSISQQAVLHTGKRDVVIISLGNGYFRAQNITLGMATDGYVQVLNGLTEGQTIVTSSQFLIDSESNLKEAVGQMSPQMRMTDTSKEKRNPPGKEPMPGMPGMSMDNKSSESSSQKDSMPSMKTMQPRKKVYTCPMDPDVVSDHPGKCPKCGMELEIKR